MPTSYQHVRNFGDLRDGDILLYRGGGLLGRIMLHTHGELVKWERDQTGALDTLMVVGFREGVGNRKVTLSSQVRKYPKKIDVYRFKDLSDADAYGAAQILTRQTGQPYGWIKIWIAFLWHLMLIRFIIGKAPDGMEKVTIDEWRAAEVCSSGVINAVRRQLGDARRDEWPLPGVPSWRCFPQRIAEDSGTRILFEALYHEEKQKKHDCLAGGS